MQAWFEKVGKMFEMAFISGDSFDGSILTNAQKKFIPILPLDENMS